MAKGRCAKCPKVKAHPKSAYCDDHRREYMRQWMRDRKSGKTGTRAAPAQLKVPHWLGNAERFLDKYDKLKSTGEDPELFQEIGAVLEEFNVIVDGKLNYMKIHIIWPQIGDALGTKV